MSANHSTIILHVKRIHISVLTCIFGIISTTGRDLQLAEFSKTILGLMLCLVPSKFQNFVTARDKPSLCPSRNIS